MFKMKEAICFDHAGQIVKRFGMKFFSVRREKSGHQVEVGTDFSSLFLLRV